MKKSITNRLRFKLYTLIIPLVALTVLSSGVLSSLASQKALISAANQHLAYKAEQIRDYIYSEWTILERLNLSTTEEYTEAAKKSFRSYAQALLRTQTEELLIIDSKGSLLHRFSLSLTPDMDDALGTIIEPVQPGWFSKTILENKRIGVAFTFDPLGWTILVTETNDHYFSAVKEIIYFQILILLVAIVFASCIIMLYVVHVSRPVEHLASTIEEIQTTHNLSHRATVEDSDEIGFIAKRFNNMISTLQVYQDQIKRTSLAEITSRKQAIRSELETLYLLGRVSDFRDEQTGDHQNRISSLTALFCQLLNFDLQKQEIIMNASRLHDIGKIAIPDSILLKKGSLTEEEFEIIKTHTTLGKDLLKSSMSETLVEAAIIAYTHHEHWDGSGYPQGLMQEDIPLTGRIVSIVDVFDALISTRPYKTAWSIDRAKEYLVEKRGTQFDPELIGFFISNFPRFTSLLTSNSHYQ